MEGMRTKYYLRTTKKRFDPFSLIVSTAGLAAVIVAVANFETARNLLDLRSFLIVFIGTIACVLFQYDLRSVFASVVVVLRSFLGTPSKQTLLTIRQLDEAIVSNAQILSLRAGDELDGDLLNDIVYMYRRGLLFEEIDEFITSRIAEEVLDRQVAVAVFRRASIIAPALGLFGTVIGLIGVLNSLDDPSQIGPSMSLALMTTAYGAGLGSLVLNPLAGRLEHHNTIYVEIHKRLMSKVGIMLIREERHLDSVHIPEQEPQ